MLHHQLAIRDDKTVRAPEKSLVDALPEGTMLVLVFIGYEVLLSVSQGKKPQENNSHDSGKSCHQAWQLPGGWQT